MAREKLKYPAVAIYAASYSIINNDVTDNGKTTGIGLPVTGKLPFLRNHHFTLLTTAQGFSGKRGTELSGEWPRGVKKQQRTDGRMDVKKMESGNKKQKGLRQRRLNETTSAPIFETSEVLARVTQVIDEMLFRTRLALRDGRINADMAVASIDTLDALKQIILQIGQEYKGPAAGDAANGSPKRDLNTRIMGGSQ